LALSVTDCDADAVAHPPATSMTVAMRRKAERTARFRFTVGRFSR
jgi:hypothetical protein